MSAGQELHDSAIQDRIEAVTRISSHTTNRACFLPRKLMEAVVSAFPWSSQSGPHPPHSGQAPYRDRVRLRLMPEPRHKRRSKSRRGCGKRSDKGEAPAGIGHHYHHLWCCRHCRNHFVLLRLEVRISRRSRSLMQPMMFVRSYRSYWAFWAGESMQGAQHVVVQCRCCSGPATSW